MFGLASSRVLSGRIFKLSVLLGGFLLSGLLFMVFVAHPAKATFPGSNGKIAFESNFNDGSGPDFEIYAVEPSGGPLTNLTNNSAEDEQPSWSADGTKVAFRSNSSGAIDIWVLDTTDSSLTQVTNNAAVESFPVWSPNGSQLAWIQAGQVFVGNSDGSGTPISITAGQPINIAPSASRSLDWSVDNQIAFSSSNSIFTINPNGTGLTQITDNGSSPSWSPDGDKIAFNRDNNIYTMNGDGTAVTQITTGFVIRAPVWSPDSSQFAFINIDDFGNINTVNADGSGTPTSVTNLVNSINRNPTWGSQSAPQFNFTGFFAPINNPPVLNSVKAGQGVPVKFSLDGDQGLDIFADGYPKSQQVTCDTSAPVDGVEETTTAGNSTLQYDPTTDQYTYVWKTDKSWSKTCRQLIVQLSDGSTYTANFTLK